MTHLGMTMAGPNAGRYCELDDTDTGNREEGLLWPKFSFQCFVAVNIAFKNASSHVKHGALQKDYQNIEVI